MTTSVIITGDTTFTKLARITKIPVKDLVAAMAAKGFKLKGKTLVRSTIPNYTRIKSALAQYGVTAKFQKLNAEALAKNDKYNASIGSTVIKPAKKVAVKKTSNNDSGLTIRELEKEIFKVEGIRVVIRAASHLRSGCTVYGKSLPKNATVASLTKRLNGYFRQSRHADDLVDVEFVVITPRGNAHHNTRTKILPLDRVRFE